MHARWDQEYSRQHPEACIEYPESEIRERIAENYAELFGVKAS